MTTSILTPDQPGSSSLVKRYPLATFFLLVFGLTWPFMIVDALGARGILPFQTPMPLMLVQGYMPTLAAVIVTGLITGRAGIRALFGKLLIARVGFRWYAFALFGLGVISVAAILLTNLFGPPPPLPILSKDIPPSAGPVGLLLNIVLLFFVSAIINGEELAWRGFALPRLQARYNALTASLILSVPWIMFHLPLFFTPGSTQADMSFASYAVSLVGMTVLFTWMFNHTRGSVLLAYLLHASMNTWTQIFSIDPANDFQSWVLAGLIVALAAIVVAIYGAENLTRSGSRIRE